MQAYSGFAEVYDEFMDNVPYEEWADRFDALIRRYSMPDSPEDGNEEKKILVDLGCGTGVLTELMAGKGYNVWGIDLSPEMLAVAQEHKASTGQDILYICQDMREVELPFQVPYCISACDCVNYLLTGDDLLAMFRSVHSSLLPDGLFLFDFNTLHKYRDVIGDTTIAESRETAAFIWENWFDPDSRINEYDLTLFTKKSPEDPDSEEFLRSIETHYQRGYTAEEMLSCAQKAGFRLLESMDADDNGPVRSDSERVLFVLRK